MKTKKISNTEAAIDLYIIVSLLLIALLSTILYSKNVDLKESKKDLAILENKLNDSKVANTLLDVQYRVDLVTCADAWEKTVAVEVAKCEQEKIEPRVLVVKP